MDEIIKPPERILSDVGKDIKDFVELLGELPSRRRAFEGLKSALEKIKRMEGKVEPIFIVGEWGEGKTTLYDAYLSTTEDIGITFAVSTPTVMEYLRRISKKQYLPEGESPGYKLLSAILASLTENQKNKLEELGVKNLPHITDYSSSLNYVHDYLNVLYGYVISKYPYIIFYLDEFEDIVTIKDTELLGLVFSGLIEVINGVVEEVFVNKQSKIHLIISVTPPALAQLGVSGLDTIVGRLKRRENRIDLTPLPREERLLFIRGIIRYMWNVNYDLMPKIFSPVSVINPLLIATLGNIAALKKAVEDTIIKSIDTENDVFNPIFFYNMYQILKELKVNIAGAELELFNKTLFDRILSNWESYCRYYCEHLKAKPQFTYEESKPILELFIATFGILPRKELPEITNIDWLKVQEILSQLNRIFGERAILGAEFGTKRFTYQTEKLPNFSKVKRIFELLREEILRQIPSLGEFTGGHVEEDIIEQILDRMSFVDEKGELCLFIPSLEDLDEAKDYIKEIVPAEISDDEASKFIRILNKLLEQCRDVGTIPEEKYHILSPKLIDILYLSPQLLHLDFIADRTKRFEIWRKLLANITSTDLAYGFLTLLQGLRVAVKDYRVLPTFSENLHFAELYHSETETTIRTLLLTVPRAITEDDIDAIVKALEENIKDRKPVHCVIMVYAYDIQETANVKLNGIENKYFTKIIKVKIPSHLQLVKLGAIGRVLRETFLTLTLPGIQTEIEEIINYGGYDQETGFDVSRLVGTLKTLSSELNLDKGFKELFESLVTLKDLTLETGGVHVDSPSKLRDGLRYFLVSLDDQGDFNGCLRHARRDVMRYHIYGWKRGILSGDIESEEELAKRAVILSENGYLEVNRFERKWKLVPVTPIEKRIIRILETVGGEITEEHLKDYFIVLAQSSHLQAILKILDDKGIINYDDKKRIIKLIKSGTVREKIDKLYYDIEQKLERDKDLIENFGFICSGKERDYRIAIMKDFFNIIKKYLDLAKSSLSVGEVEKSLRYLKTAEDLLNIYDDLRGYMEASSNIIKKLIKEFEEGLDQLNGSSKTLEKLINNYVVKKQVRINLKTINDLVMIKKIINEEIRKQYNLEELENIIGSEWAKNKGKDFIFYKDRSGPKYNFNFKFWKIIALLYEKGIIKEENGKFELSNSIYRLKRDIENFCETIRNTVNNLTEVQRLIFEIRSISKKSQILLPLLQRIEEVYVAKIPTDKENIESIEDVKDLVDLWIREIGNVENLIKSLRKVQERTQQVIRKEDDLAALRKKVHEMPSRLMRQFEGCETNFEEIVTEIKIFEEYTTNVIPNEFDRIKQEVEKFSKVCNMTEIPEWVKENVLNKFESLESKLLSGMDRILRKIETVYFQSIRTLRISIECALGLESKMPQDYIDNYNKFKEEFAKLNNTLNRVPRSKLDELSTYGVSLCQLYNNLTKVEKELWELIKQSGILVENEIQIYREYVSIKLQTQKEMTLNEFASYIGRSLNLEASDVKEILKNLINKEIIIPKL